MKTSCFAPSLMFYVELCYEMRETPEVIYGFRVKMKRWSIIYGYLRIEDHVIRRQIPKNLKKWCHMKCSLSRFLICS